MYRPSRTTKYEPTPSLTFEILLFLPTVNVGKFLADVDFITRLLLPSLGVYQCSKCPQSRRFAQPIIHPRTRLLRHRSRMISIPSTLAHSASQLLLHVSYLPVPNHQRKQQSKTMMKQTKMTWAITKTATNEP